MNKKIIMYNTKLHRPVLLEKTLEVINPQPGEKYLDLTAGYGGHARSFLSITKNYQDTTLVDRDDFAIENLRDLEKQGVNLIHTSFYLAAQMLVAESKKFDIVLMDLGVSSPQLDNADRGFSFANSGPLDMRMDRRGVLSAYQIVNEYSESELVKILFDYGEEKRSQAAKIAHAIVSSRPIETTDQLAEIIKSVSARKFAKIHPATRSFQAIRIAVNDELGEIERTLALLPSLLAKNGRVGVISFHSLEDRLVKRFLKSDSDQGLESKLSIITPKPISGKIYDVNNPRARSAKLRVAVKN